MFCLMTTHVHLLLETRRENELQTAMKSINWCYAYAFNRRYGRSGHLFGRRYWCKQVVSSGQLLAATRYIARNPVRAELCGRAEDWFWGSYAGTVGVADPFPFIDATPILAEFADDLFVAAAELRAFVAGEAPPVTVTARFAVTP
jgi:hypothetical protein